MIKKRPKHSDSRRGKVIKKRTLTNVLKPSLLLLFSFSQSVKTYILNTSFFLLYPPLGVYYPVSASVSYSQTSIVCQCEEIEDLPCLGIIYIPNSECAF